MVTQFRPVVLSKDQVVERVFWALQTHGREALAALAACPNDPQVVLQWAVTHYLNTVDLVEYATALRARWEKYPALAAELDARYRQSVTVYYDDSGTQRDWLNRVQASFQSWAPDPAEESLDDWRRRADDLYQQRVDLYRAKGTPLHRGVRTNYTRKFEWFVLCQVTGLTLQEIATDSEVSRNAVERAVIDVAQMVGVERRRRPRGRQR